MILAGGRGSRLGAAVPKPLVELLGRPLIAHVLDRVPESCRPVLVAANNPDAFAPLGLPVVADRFAGFPGPLAGLDAANARLKREHPEINHVLALPGDTPFLPRDIAERLLARLGPRPRLARFGDRLQPTVALWPLACLDRLPDLFGESTERSVRAFAGACGFDPVDFAVDPAAPGGDPFFNINTPADLALARRFPPA